MEYSDAAHKRAVEIEATLNAVRLSAKDMERAQKALLPIYEPLVPNYGGLQRGIGADYLEAFADREEGRDIGTLHIGTIRRMRECAKSERAIGS